MSRRAFTLIEILIALVIMGIVTTMAMTMFRFQNTNWKNGSDRAEASLMARGVLDDLARSVRMTGGWLPERTAGLKVWGGGEEQVTFVVNGSGWIDTAGGGTFEPDRKRLRIAVDSAGMFSQEGYALLSVKVPMGGAVAPAIGSITRMVRLGILERVGSSSGCGDSLVLDASTLVDPPFSWDWPQAVLVPAGTLVYNLDSVTWRKSHDTLWTQWNRQPPSVYALGIDTLSLSYFHPVTGWRDSLSGAAPVGRVEKVRIRLVTRSQKVDRQLLRQNPSTRGYRFSTLETEVSLRNDSLINR
ncbi:MAG: type II secretion system protein [Fibrobacteria bacterium]|nr:type II secretion system protein [Fibrobacteria bacterium]